MLFLTILSSALVGTAFASLDGPSLANSLLKRQATTDASYLPSIAGNISTPCFTACTPFMTDLSACVNAGGTTIQLATCACAAPALSATKTCAQCITNDPASTQGQAQVNNYNGFAQQCIAVNLASSAILISPASTAAVAGASSAAVAATTAPSVATTTRAPAASGTVTSDASSLAMGGLFAMVMGLVVVL